MVDLPLHHKIIKPEELRAARVLWRRLGLRATLSLGAKLEWARRRGEPFERLAPPVDEREQQSRQQIGPAILLYRALLDRGMPRDQALSLVEEVILEATLAFLGRTIGPLRRADLEALDDQERGHFVRRLGRRFFNATLRWDTVAADQVAFTVTHCHFPSLCAAAGHPELAPLFCKGDALYFGQVEPDVLLERPHTIAGGAPTCPFTLRYSDRGGGG